METQNWSIIFHRVQLYVSSGTRNNKHCVTTRDTGCPKKVLRLTNDRTKVFCSIFKFSFVLDRLDPKLDFDISVLKIGQKLTESR